MNGRYRLPTGRLSSAPSRALSLIGVWGVLCALSIGVCSCGSTQPAAPPVRATLVLDFTPNAVHAGIYRALAAGYYKREHIDLQVVQPTSTQETLKLIDAGKAQFGLADGGDVAGLIGEGGDAQAVMALVQAPLGGLIALASERLRSPADLAGKAVGITGVPSDRAVLDTELHHAGVSPARVKVVTVGFNGGQALVAGKIAAFTGFIPDDGVALSASAHPIAAFALNRNGGPAYPGLVAFTTRRLIASDPQLVKDFVAATVHGYEDTLANPQRSLAEPRGGQPDLAPQADSRLPKGVSVSVRCGRSAFRDLAGGQCPGDVELDGGLGPTALPDRLISLRHERISPLSPLGRSQVSELISS